MRKTRFPRGWSKERVERVLDHYETQSEEEATAEDEAAFSRATTTIKIPAKLLPKVRALIAKEEPKSRRERGLRAKPRAPRGDGLRGLRSRKPSRKP